MRNLNWLLAIAAVALVRPALSERQFGPHAMAPNSSKNRQTAEDAHRDGTRKFNDTVGACFMGQGVPANYNAVGTPPGIGLNYGPVMAAPAAADAVPEAPPANESAAKSATSTNPTAALAGLKATATKCKSCHQESQGFVGDSLETLRFIKKPNDEANGTRALTGLANPAMLSLLSTQEKAWITEWANASR